MRGSDSTGYLWHFSLGDGTRLHCTGLYTDRFVQTIGTRGTTGVKVASQYLTIMFQYLSSTLSLWLDDYLKYFFIK